ncbi:MAG: HAD hydrolase-like protein [Patescibacteria group bacterium]|jgi:FMN phosphatase YigB (HAD superfamily)
MVKLIIFDCYGLILNAGYPNTSKELAKRYGGNWKTYQQKMYSEYFNLAAIRKISQKEAWQKTVEYFNLPITWQQLRDVHYKLMKIDNRVLVVNRDLNRRGYVTLLLTKNTRSQFVDAIVKKFRLRNEFKNIINTWELNLPKASKKTLRVVMKRFNVTPREIVYADDQESNLVDAKALGMKTVLVKSFSQFNKELNIYLDHDQK